jgi:hypothetical protein
MGQGKEAVTMRQAILVIVLIASSFLGGAFVNGPGLRWAQTRLFRSLGLDVETEIASVDLMPAATPPGASDSADPAKVAREPAPEPLAPMPTVVAEDDSSHKVPSEPQIASNPKAGEKPHRGSSSKNEPPSTTPSLPAPAPTASTPQRPASSDSEVKPAGASAEMPGASDRKAQPALLDSLGSLLPAASPPSSEGSADPVPLPPLAAVKSARSLSDDWNILQQKLRAMNVSRFTIEGEPSGRVLFSCLIPLAGRQAVAQRFEAEGDDVIQAVQATLRRIALWRATQPQPK